MTRIYTNVPAMITRANLHQNMSVLQTSLERLSTGFKINSGKDDPAGLIASEMLRSDITGIKVAIKNTERANMMIATAESALNEVTNLLNDIRGLITEAANTGAMSLEMIEANQLQVDASLDAIDRIAAQTTFMGQKLLDGSLDFTIVGIDRNNLKGLAVHQATFGANKSPSDVVINVQEAAEKAALYFNQPALAEDIILRWGGNYGYAQESFKKGASVAQIADIINKRSDGTGVIAEVGSDALKGLLYVSSLGSDNDIIIEAGLAGLNEGNVQIKYMKGSSEGIQIRYEEPVSPGAPANIIVYLQTDAYNAAFANEIDTTWVMENGKLVPMKDNNALKFEAAIEGSKYNGSSIFYVDGATDPRFYDASANPTGTAGQPYAYYADSGRSSTALFGNIPGVAPAGNIFSGLGLGEYFAIQTRNASSTYNNVNVQFVAANPGDAVLGGRNASALYSDFNNNKTLTIYYNNNGNTSLQDVQEALRLERHVDAKGNVVQGAFEVQMPVAGKTLLDVTLQTRTAGIVAQSSNTHNSGGPEGSLFIVIPPDGMMPARPDVPEMPGVTTRAVADGIYLAHKGTAWDNYTLEFQRTGSGLNISYLADTKTIRVSASADTTYEQILTALRNPMGDPSTGLQAWTGASTVPPELRLDAQSLYWSNVAGVEIVPGVPTSMTPTVTTGVVGRSLTPVLTIPGQGGLYLKHTNSAFDNLSIAFNALSTPGHAVRVSGTVATGLVVEYDNGASYDDILTAINDYKAIRDIDVTGPFTWAKADGTAFFAPAGSTGVVASQPERYASAMVGNGTNDVMLRSVNYDDQAWNGVQIVFNNDSSDPPTASVTGSPGSFVITVNYTDGTSTYRQILDAINKSGDFPMLNAESPLRWEIMTDTDVFVAPSGGSVTLGGARPYVPGHGGAYDPASSALQATNTGTVAARSVVPIGDGYYLAHEDAGNTFWDNRTINFASTGTTGGSVTVSFDGINLSVRSDTDARYNDILDALNDPSVWIWTGVNPIPTTPSTVPRLSFSDASGKPVDPSAPKSLVSSTSTGTYRPYQYSPDGRSERVAVLPNGKNLYLQHTDKSWDNLNINFTTIPKANPLTDPPIIQVTFDGKAVTVIMSDDVTYDQILFALNNPLGGTYDVGGPYELVTPAWQDPAGGNPRAPLPVGNNLFWVDENGRRETVTQIQPGMTQILAGVGTDDSVFISHSDPAWDKYNIRFDATGQPDPVNPSQSPVMVSISGDVITVKYDATINPATYQDILDAINGPWSTKPTGIGDFSFVFGATSGVSLTNAFAPTNTSVPVPLIDVQHVVADRVTNVVPGRLQVDPAGIFLTHTDPAWGMYNITFADGTGNGPGTVSISGSNITVTYDSAVASYQSILSALNNPWTGKPVGIGPFAFDYGTSGVPSTNPFTAVMGSTSLAADGTVVQTIVDAPLAPRPVLNLSVNAGAVYREVTAADIAAIFDMNNNASRGSERAANLFNVSTTVDNDGSGVIRLYDYWVDVNGNVIGWTDASGKTYGDTNGKQIITKTAFEKAFTGGSDGGSVVTTAAELITALNNSAFWGGMMCSEMLADLAKENAKGLYYDAEDVPVITARLAPNNNGYGVVSTFQEVAYYGNPNEGTALQFLGGYNAPNIRFVVDGPNSPLSVDRTTVPAVVGNAQAVLTAQDSGASMTITAVRPGEEYDDVLFVFKRVGEDAYGLLAPDRKDGWVEYDEGISRAFAQATFTDATTNNVVPNSAFFITATDRGDLYNNVEVMMRLNDQHTASSPIVVTFDSRSNQLRISIDSTRVGTVTTNDIIAAINDAKVGFQAELSYAEDPLNNGTGTLDSIGLSAARFTTVANTGETGGRKGGTVTVWLADANAGPGGPADGRTYRSPTQEDIVRLINSDPVVNRLFVARSYNTSQVSDGKSIDFVKDGPIITSGGLVSPALITVHLATDAAGNVTTTAKQLEKWWNELDAKLVDGISVSIVRPPGAVWDDCDDPYGNGFLAPTIALKLDCDEWLVNDIAFVGWNDNAEQQHFIAKYSTGVMTSQRGINSSYQLIAKNLGPDYDGYTIEYINDDTITGRYADNLVAGSDVNPCDGDHYSGLPHNDCGEYSTPTSTTANGLSLKLDPVTKKITINVKFGVTTANDIQQLIAAHKDTRNIFRVEQLGNGTGFIHADDNTLLTKDGASPPGELNGAKLLFGSDATDYYLILRSREYGSDQYVDVVAKAVETGATTTFAMTNSDGQVVERAYGKDADVLVNGIQASVRGLNVSLNSAALAMDFILSQHAGTTAGFSTGFTIAGGGATFQVGPDVVTRQQITMGIRSINTVMLGGSSGVLNQLRSGMDASLHPDKGNTNKAFRIVEESLLAITAIRGRLGTMQRATLETNINVLNDTLSALVEAESQIRDTDFAEETSNLTRAQILVQANMNTLGIANQIPNYMLSLLGR